MDSKRISAGRTSSTENQTLARGLQVLQLLSDSPAELGVREIARATSMGASMVQRLINTLAARGFVEQNPETRKYTIGHGAFIVGSRYLAGKTVVDVALPILRALADEHEINAFLGVERDGKVVYLLVIQSSGPIAVRAVPGQRENLHSTAMGKSLLAGMPRARADAFLHAGPLAKRTDRTRTDPLELRAELDAVAADGYAINNEENLSGVYAVGAPVRNAAGQVIAAISGANAASMIDEARRARMRTLVMDAADRISRRLGAQAV